MTLRHIQSDDVERSNVGGCVGLDHDKLEQWGSADTGSRMYCQQSAWCIDCPGPAAHCQPGGTPSLAQTTPALVAWLSMDAQLLQATVPATTSSHLLFRREYQKTKWLQRQSGTASCKRAQYTVWTWISRLCSRKVWRLSKFRQPQHLIVWEYWEGKRMKQQPVWCQYATRIQKSARPSAPACQRRSVSGQPSASRRSHVLMMWLTWILTPHAVKEEPTPKKDGNLREFAEDTDK